ncbi:nucleoside hydrolase [Erysipelothrix rhusiopathiae]|nr:nucleoside hydrolase [Erysipelothrix rhusiopathiae]
MKRKIIIDCDPGHDDAMAIMWALASPELDILGITTVAGNQTLSKVTENTLRILTLLGHHEIPVAVGMSQPLVRNLEIGGELVHGDSGLEGPELPERGFDPIKEDAVSFIIRTLEASKEPITLVPLGPLTNIALVLRMRPDLMDKIELIALMGGGTVGNYTPAAEYNIWADAEAAKVVFNSEIEILMAGLDVTQKAYITREENEILRKQGNKGSIFAAELIDYFSKYHYEVEGFPGCTLHDPTVIGALVQPEMFESIQCNVDVETQGTLTYGMTVVDTINYQEKIFGVKRPQNVKFLKGVNREVYVENFFKAMSRL